MGRQGRAHQRPPGRRRRFQPTWEGLELVRSSTQACACCCQAWCVPSPPSCPAPWLTLFAANDDFGDFSSAPGSSGGFGSFAAAPAPAPVQPAKPQVNLLDDFDSLSLYGLPLSLLLHFLNTQSQHKQARTAATIVPALLWQCACPCTSTDQPSGAVHIP